MLTFIDLFNIVMAIGIAALAYANFRLGRANKVLREINGRERRNEKQQWRQRLHSDAEIGIH